jgi:hypothetical protein
LSITFDAEAEPGQAAMAPTPARWRGLAMRAVAAACLGFAAGYGVATLRPGTRPAEATPLALAAYAVSEANLARAAADLAIEMERLVEAERDYASFRAHREEDDALLRSGLALRDALRAGGSYAAPLAALRGIEDGEKAIAPIAEELLRGVDGVPDRPGLSAQLDAIAMSVLALGEEEPMSWPSRMSLRIRALVRGDNAAALQERRSQVFAVARDAAARGALQDAIAALGPLDAEAAGALSGWIEASMQRIALDAMADRVAAVVTAYAYR